MEFKQDNSTLGELCRSLATVAGCDQFHQNTEPCRPVHSSSWGPIWIWVAPNGWAGLSVSFITIRVEAPAWPSGGSTTTSTTGRKLLLWLRMTELLVSPEKLVLLLQQANTPLAEAMRQRVSLRAFVCVCVYACVCVRGESTPVSTSREPAERGGVALVL